MHLWHYRLLPYLPARQFNNQLTDLVSTLHAWERGVLKGTICESYEKEDLYDYFCVYQTEYNKRYNVKLHPSYHEIFFRFAFGDVDSVIRGTSADVYYGWHDVDYLRICMAILLDLRRSSGINHVSDEEWLILERGYKEIRGVAMSLATGRRRIATS